MERGAKNHAKICHASCIQMETSSSPITYEPKHPRRKSREALLPRALVSLHYKSSLKKTRTKSILSSSLQYMTEDVDIAVASCRLFYFNALVSSINKFFDVADLLLQNSADVNVADNLGALPCMWHLGR